METDTRDATVSTRAPAQADQTIRSTRRGNAARLLAYALGGLALLFVLGYAGASGYITDQARHAARHLPDGSPADVGLVYEPVTFESAEDRLPLHGWYMPSRGERAIVMVHGIDSQRWDTSSNIPDKARLYVHDGFDVLVFDLRAHGESGGDYLGLGWLERRDVQGAIKLVEERGIPAGRIGLHGHSLGGAIALLSTAAIPDVRAVIADSAFDDERLLIELEITRRTGAAPIFMPGVGLFIRWWYGFDLSDITPERAMSSIAPRPVLLIHGTADTRIPVEHAYRLMAAANNAPGVELWTVQGADHVASFATDRQGYTARMLAFFEHAL
jgi:dipeptidyl aminopeptidase/acylaminoacyl peptidase